MIRSAILTLIVPDTHIGAEQDLAAQEIAIKIAQTLRPDHIVHLGDLMDLGALSSHARSSPHEGIASFPEEVRQAKRFIRRLRGRRATPFTLIEGNHEWRLDRYLMKNAPELVGEVTIQKALGEVCTQIVPYVGPNRIHEHYRIAPNLVAIHGWSYAKNAAAVHLAHAKPVSVIFGHCHRAMTVYERHPLTGRAVLAACPGTIGPLIPAYNTHSPGNWTQGVGLVYQSAHDPEDWTYLHVPIRADGSGGARAILPTGKREIEVSL